MILYNKGLDKIQINLNSKIGAKLNCNPNWPVCIFDHCYKHKSISYFAYRTKQLPDIYPDYFSPSHKIFPGNDKVEKLGTQDLNFDKLTIERNTHYCKDEEFTSYIKELIDMDTEASDEIFNHPTNFIEETNELQIQVQMKSFIDYIKNKKMDIKNTI